MSISYNSFIDLEQNIFICPFYKIVPLMKILLCVSIILIVLHHGDHDSLLDPLSSCEPGFLLFVYNFLETGKSSF